MRPLLLLLLCAACTLPVDVAHARSAVANVTLTTLLSGGSDSSTLRDALAAVDNDVCLSLKHTTHEHTHCDTSLPMQLVYMAHTKVMTTVGTTTVDCPSGQCGVLHSVGTDRVFSITDAPVTFSSVAAGRDTDGAWHVYAAGLMASRRATTVPLADGSVAIPGRSAFVLQMRPNLTVENVLTFSEGSVDRVAVAGTDLVVLHRAFNKASVEVSLNGHLKHTIALKTAGSSTYSVCTPPNTHARVHCLSFSCLY